MIKKEKIVDREEDHNKLYRGIMDKVIDGKGSVSSPTKELKPMIKRNPKNEREIWLLDKKDGFKSFLQRIEELKRMVFSKGDITYNKGVNDVKKVFLLCLKEFRMDFRKKMLNEFHFHSVRGIAKYKRLFEAKYKRLFEESVKRFLGRVRDENGNL